MELLEQFVFVLFRPKSAGNVGAAARALKNMGLTDLRLVAPRAPDLATAAARAVHGRDLLARAGVFPDLAAALHDCNITVGTTARTDSYCSETQPLRAALPSLVAAAAHNRVALVFGPEDHGLTNREVAQCQRLLTIPTAAAYPSLNLAQAVMVVAYELMLAAAGARDYPALAELAPANAVSAMLARMATALTAIGFLPEDNPDHIMQTLRRIFGRSGLRPRELRILNGIVRQIQWYAQGGRRIIEAKQHAGLRLR